MSQFSNPYGASATDPYTEPKKRSGLSVTALVMSLIGIIPCCGAISAPIGAILGMIGAIIIKPSSAVKGRGMSVVALIIGAFLTVVQIGGGMWAFNALFMPVAKGPDAALRAGFAGNVTAFKAEFYGPGNSTSDAEITTFIEQLRARYGEYQSCEMDQSQNRQQTFGQPEATFPYNLTFANKTVKCDAHMIFSDKTKGGFIMKWGTLTVFDSDAGDLHYPASPPAAAPRTSVPDTSGTDVPSSPAGDAGTP